MKLEALLDEASVGIISFLGIKLSFVAHNPSYLISTPDNLHFLPFQKFEHHYGGMKDVAPEANQHML